MSLPPATKDISANPAKGSVVDPVDRNAQAADVDRKIRFYGVIEALRKGRLPDNQQILNFLAYIRGHSPVTLEKLSPEGRKLVRDTRDIIDTASLLVQEKNADELFQAFVWHTRTLEIDTLKPGDLGEGVDVNQEKLKKDGEQGESVRHLRTLLSLILTNSEVRKLLQDFSTIGRDLLAKTAVKAAETIAPSNEALENVDQSAPNDQFHPKQDEAIRPIGEVKAQGTERYQQLRSQGVTAGNQVLGETQSQARDIQNAESSEEAEVKKQGDGLSDRIPQQHKDTANDKLERGRKFLTEEYFPEERRDQFIFRGKKVIMECQKHDDYQESITWLLDYFDEYVGHGRGIAGNGHEHVKGVANDSKLSLSVKELRTLLERFANNTSMDVIFDAIDVLVDDARHDQALGDWFRSVDAYIRKVLLEPGYVLEPDCDTQADRLRESGRTFYDDKYRSHFDNLFSSAGSWFGAMGEDPLNKRFGEDWARLTRDLLFDSEGSLKFKPHLWNDIRRVIVPQLIEHVGYVPIPRIEYTDDSLDLVVENLTLQGRNLFPNIASLDAHNFVKFSPYNAIKDDSYHRITISLEQVQADMRDVAFYYRKKTGLPKMRDSGLADVILGGEGLSATIVLVSPPKHDRSSVFRVESVHVKVDTLKFSIRDSKHDFLYKTLKPLATGLVKRQIQKALKDALTTGLEYVDGQLVGVRERMDSAKGEDEGKIDVLKDIFSRKTDNTGSIKSGVSSQTGSHFKVVADKRNSLLVGTGSPAGWVNKTAEKEQLATHGDEWRSEAFNVV
ncbi:uncharacterized protein LACBIDRAFT_187323 [Laccaria bicolor S238N-H82]|uniref:Predicted protein n=1 Tax=Laccaria bicolor (strain S238N-H82 / ATCC MYA-4686) TaxID=486041 RepID=B0CPZ0_LACBS|nr:uncharacterized protein LACBIDRAFT_187323 [Laccaria bicolor S238N-H82]EDR16148.1 predicted protein [Laccaria bicolor S238N-H82]|eukprot:XP_001874356.1 predicted protein [Laccaria bicolor S238N-H82]